MLIQHLLYSVPFAFIFSARCLPPFSILPLSFLLVCFFVLVFVSGFFLLNMNYTVDSQPACNFPHSLRENLRLRDWSPSPADPTCTCPSASTPHCPAAGPSSLTWTSVVVASLALQLRTGPCWSVFSVAARMIAVILHIVQSLRHA